MRPIKTMNCPICGQLPVPIGKDANGTIRINGEEYRQTLILYGFAHCGIESGYFQHWDRAVIGWNMAVDWYNKYEKEQNNGTE